MITRKTIALLPALSHRTTALPFVCSSCRTRSRALHAPASRPKPEIPAPTPFVPNVSTFLSLIGRSLSEFAPKVRSWEELFSLSSEQLKKRGLENTRSRRYLLRWREKFRRGDYGIGGDLKFVTDDGTAMLRVVEVPSLQKEGEEARKVLASVNRTPGYTKLIVNVPEGEESYVLQEGESTQDLKKPGGMTLKEGHRIVGSYVYPVKGSNGSVATIKWTEGMWEDRRGRKLFGGERRRAETLFKLRVAENRKNRR